MKIVGLMVCKNEADILPMMLDRNAPLFDSIYAIDNDSKDDTFNILFNHPKVKVLSFDKHEYDESYFVPELLNLAQSSGADWFCELDADEIYPEPDQVRQHLAAADALGCNTMSVHIRAVLGMNEIKQYREWKRWLRFYKNVPSLFSTKEIKKLHNGKCPIPKAKRITHHSGVKAFHFSLRSAAHAHQKYQRYLKLDPNCEYQPGGYEHIKEIANVLESGDFSRLEFL